MDSYNLKVVEYVNSTKLVKYSRPVRTGFKKAVPDDGILDGDALPDAESPAALHAGKRTDAEAAARHSLNVSLNRTKNAIYDLAKSNDWEWFVTFTFDPKKHDNTDYDVVTKLFKRFIDRVRKSAAPSLVYLVVPELHADGKKWHLHGLFSHMGEMRFFDSGHKGDYGETVYNLRDWKYGFSTATQIKDPVRASAYITKYITKEVVRHTRNKRRYLASRNIKRPQVEKLNTEHSAIDIMRTYQPDYIKSTSVPAAGRKVTYMEVDY